jgi:hypothetical protein
MGRLGMRVSVGDFLPGRAGFAAGDADLDALAVDFTAFLLGIQIKLPHFTFNPQLEIRDAGFMAAETEFEGMGEIIEPKMLAAARIGAVEKRTVVSRCGHAKRRRV